MRVSFDLKKRHGVYAIVALLFFGLGFVVAYGTSDPMTFGHSVNELELDNVCLSDGTNCPADPPHPIDVHMGSGFGSFTLPTGTWNVSIVGYLSVLSTDTRTVSFDGSQFDSWRNDLGGGTDMRMPFSTRRTFISGGSHSITNTGSGGGSVVWTAVRATG